jgi:hypothetical protein
MCVCKGWSIQVHHTRKGDTNYGGTNIPSQPPPPLPKPTPALLNSLLFLEPQTELLLNLRYSLWHGLLFVLKDSRVSLTPNYPRNEDDEGLQSPHASHCGCRKIRPPLMHRTYRLPRRVVDLRN